MSDEKNAETTARSGLMVRVFEKNYQTIGKNENGKTLKNLGE